LPSIFQQFPIAWKHFPVACNLFAGSLNPIDSIHVAGQMLEKTGKRFPTNRNISRVFPTSLQQFASMFHQILSISE